MFEERALDCTEIYLHYLNAIIGLSLPVLLSLAVWGVTVCTVMGEEEEERGEGSDIFAAGVLVVIERF